MSYEKQTWNTGDTITDDKLNHMEDGIANAGGGGGLFIVHGSLSYDSTLQKDVLTVTEDMSVIANAISAGENVVMDVTDTDGDTDRLHLAYFYLDDPSSLYMDFGGITYYDEQVSTVEIRQKYVTSVSNNEWDYINHNITVAKQ